MPEFASATGGRGDPAPSVCSHRIAAADRPPAGAPSLARHAAACRRTARLGLCRRRCPGRGFGGSHLAVRRPQDQQVAERGADGGRCRGAQPPARRRHRRPLLRRERAEQPGGDDARPPGDGGRAAGPGCAGGAYRAPPDVASHPAGQVGHGRTARAWRPCEGLRGGRIPAPTRRSCWWRRVCK